MNSRTATGRKFTIAAFFSILAVVLLSYSNVYKSPFFFDDAHNIVNNPSLRAVTSIRHMFFPEVQVGISGRPAVHFSFLVNRLLLGPEPAGFRAVNVAIHIITSLFLLGITRRTLRVPLLEPRFGARADYPALFCVLLWAAHPIQTESVVYLTNRGEILASLAIVICLYGFLRAGTSPRPLFWCLLSWLAFVAGVGAKEIAAAAPVLILACEALFFRGAPGKRACRFPLFYMGFIPGAALLAWLLIRGATRASLGDTFIWWEYAFSQGRVIIHYLYQVIWPANLCLDWEWPMPGPFEGLLCLLAVGAVLFIVVRALFRRNPAAFLGVWFFVILAPSSSIVPLRKLACDYRMYLPLYAVICLAVLGGYSIFRERLENGGRTRKAAACLLAALALLFAGLSHERNRAFADEITIWRDVMEKDPGNPRAYQNLGLAFMNQGRIGEAAAAFSEGLGLFPDNAEILGNMGHVLQVMGRTEDALAHYRKALLLNFDLPEVHFNLGNINAERGNYPVAALAYKEALSINPHYFKAWLNFGNALLLNGQPGEAVKCYQNALILRPGDPQATRNLAAALEAVRKAR
ncbi:MAG: tetratricopeptide repeat protein [Deltaproteobacteria bacterium]|nr:tetratricopeptide repeat protein [Deltaproteobacteria bacterium]